MDYILEKKVVADIGSQDAVFSAIAHPALIYDSELKVNRVNDSFIEKFGCNPAGLNVREMVVLFSYRWLDEARNHISDQPSAKALKGERSSGALLSIKHKGQEYVLEVSSSPLYEHGEITGALTIWHCINGVHYEEKVKNAVLKSQHLQRQIDDYNPVGILTYKNGVVEYANQAALKILGVRSLIDLDDRKIPEMILPEIEKLLHKRIRTLQPGKLIEEAEQKIIRMNGEVRDLEIMVINASDSSNRIFQVFMNDITTQKRLNLFHNVLSSMEQHLQSPLDILQITQHAMEMVARSLCCNSAAVSFLIGNEWEVMHVYKFEESVRGMKIPVHEESHANLAIEQKKIIFIEDAFTDPRVVNDRMKKWGIRSVIVVPLYTRLERIGVIFFNYNNKKVFNHEEIYFLMRFSNSLSLALENSELFNHLQSELAIKQSNEKKLIKLNNILIALSRSSQAMLHAVSEKDYIRHICDIITRDCNQTLAWVGFQEGNKVIPRVCSGESQGYIKTLKIRTDRKPYSKGPTSMALKTKTAYVCNNISEDPDFNPWKKNALEHGINSAVSLPLIHMNEVFGVLNIYSKEKNYYTDDEILLLTELTKYLSKGIITIRLDFARKQAEEALKESEERFRMITEKSNALICELDSCGRVIYANVQYLDIFGSHVPFNNSIFDNCKPNDWSGFYNYIYNPGQKKQRNEWSLRDKNNNWRWFRCYPGIFKTSRGGKHFSLMMFDITEIKKSEQQLRKYAIDLKELNATKDKFFAIIAHDLKNPFANLIGASELLGSDSKFEPDTVKRLGKVINSSARRGFNLLQNLLDWSRSQTGAISYNPTKIILNDLIYDCWDYVKAASSAKNQKVNFLISENIEITADVNMLNTVIRNLMQNAIKFTHEKGIIKIQAKKGHKNILVSVADNGIGISRENLKKLFRIDVKFSQPGTSNETGTGLGLLLCKEFVELHKGKILVKSKEGEGSVFSFSIPLID